MTSFSLSVSLINKIGQDTLETLWCSPKGIARSVSATRKAPTTRTGNRSATNRLAAVSVKATWLAPIVTSARTGTLI